MALYAGVFGTFYLLMWLAKRNPNSLWVQVLFGRREGLDIRIKGRPLASVRNNGLAFLILGVLHGVLYIFAFWYLHPFDGGEYEVLRGIICILPAWLGFLCLGGAAYLLTAWAFLALITMIKKARGGGDG